MSSSTSSKLTLSLGDQQLAKLTNESPEIRMRALEQVETRFIRCLQHGETINFKPVLLLKQLIRWFGYTPLTAADRVLALMLELMRSDYSDAVVRKIPFQRLETELEKIRKILRCLQSKRAMELLDNLYSLVIALYKEANPSPGNNSSGESQCSVGEMELFSIESFNISPEDYEPAWSCASVDDLATMKTMVDTLTIDSDLRLQENLTNIQVKLCDYPVEQLCQPPHIFLQLLHVQQLQAGVTLLHVNRALLTFVKLLQRRLRIRNKSLDYAFSVKAQAALPQQLRVSSVLAMILNGCLELLGPPLLEHCSHNWHLIELSVEVIKTFGQIAAPIPENIVQRLGLIVPKLIRYCASFDVASVSETPSLVKKLMIPRLESLIFNGLLLDVITLSLSDNGTIDKPTARTLLQPLILDSSYLSCVPMRMHELCNLCGVICTEAAPEEQQMLRLKQAYSLALAQLVAETKLPPMELLQEQRQMCLVLLLLGSESLMKQLIQAIVKCTSFYIAKPELRQEAESLLHTLFDLPDERLRSCALRLLKQPVVEHFHAFMNNSNYMMGCTNTELAKRHILGLPMSSQLLRKLLVQGWLPGQSLQLQQWCIDYLIMVLGLAKLVSCKDFNEIFKIVMPVVPLLVCRAINQPQLQHMLWELFDPDSEYLEPPQALRGNVCYLFHPDAKFRKDAIGRVAYILVWQDHQHKYRPAMDKLCLDFIGHDVCAIQPPVNYYNFFSERSNLPYSRSLNTLLRLLETPDLKPSIRKSTLIQLNVILHNWEAVESFTTCDGAYVLCLKALHDPLLRDRSGGIEETETLLPAVSILLRVLFRSERFRHEFKDNAEMLVCLLRCLFLMPHETQLRAEVSICIFQLLFHEHMTANDASLKLDVDLSAMVVPVSYELDNTIPPTAATEGLALQQHLLVKHFDNNAAMEAQHWRLFMAHRICGSPEDLTLSEVRELDIRETLKLKPADLALVHASLVHLQVQNQLIAANNCSSHETLHQLVASIQLFLVLLRGDMLPAQCSNLWMLMHKYLRLTPGNDADMQLYMELLELCLSCLRHRLPEILAGLSNALETDPHHSFMVILRDGNVSLKLLHLVTDCLVHLLRWHRQQNNSTWHGKLFEELSTLARTHFEERKLQHVRCVLSVLRHLSERPLQLDNAKLQAYYQHYVQLSSNLRTTTQTGAQWQRDCLLIICQLQTQTKLLPPAICKYPSGNKVLRYLLGLCGHSDTEVRTLAWVALANWIKSAGNSMTSILLDFHDFLPGGLAACCLSTMLDSHEALLVRELAGRVFELVIPHIGATACTELLMYHSFLKHAHAALVALQLSPDKRQDTNKAEANSSFEIINCCVSICVTQVALEPSWCSILCNHAFFNSLSDLMKMSTPGKPYCSVYLELCAGQICKLYAMCYQYNFQFLQRSICRDPVLLKSFFSLINDVLDQKVVPENQLVQMLKLLMVFCKDQNAYDFLCEKFKTHPELLFDLLLYGLNQILIHRTVQRYTLLALSLLLIKAQDAAEEHNLLRVFEAYVEETHVSDEEKDEEDDTDTDTDSDDKENSTNALNKQLKILSLKPLARQKLPLTNPKQAAPVPGQSKEFTNAAVLLYHSLDQLFELHYPAKTYSFLQAPSKSHVQICEVLGNLLKQSAWAADAARHFKLLERVIHLLETFLDDATVGNATVYVRRVGAHKSRDIINNLLVLLNMLMHWQNTPHAVITDPVMAARVVRVLVRLWPWLSHSAVLKHMTVRLTTLLTEHSFEMCKQTSQVLSSQSHSLLQLMVRVADHESTKKDGSVAKPDFAKCSSDSIIDAALRVMINCCSCAEGRLSLGKMRVLDMFDTIMPASNSNSAKVKSDILLAWLAFWEVFSRYELGYKICHLQALINLVRRSPPLSKMRMRCLRIIRNMCFSNHNRMLLVNMAGFPDFLRDIVSQPVQDGSGGGDTNVDSYVEHHLVVLCLWKLFGFSAKCKAMLRGTKLHKQLTMLWDHLVAMETERPHQFKTMPFAAELKDLLAKLFDSLQP
ncbi:protein rotatin homolog isoform X2 [Drosophila montana]|uniref:protein rotatin homolog isoform X2 n=1 Tax=Drosophila montana TaxID=40370 RepID=UPI00313F3899